MELPYRSSSGHPNVSFAPAAGFVTYTKYYITCISSTYMIKLLHVYVHYIKWYSDTIVNDEMQLQND